MEGSGRWRGCFRHQVVALQHGGDAIALRVHDVLGLHPRDAGCAEQGGVLQLVDVLRDPLMSVLVLA